MIGKTISHYKIIEKIGGGGMGVVYKAEDTKLKRTVALKFLPQGLTRNAEAKRRFIKEAQTASALDHPNISNIHEIDETDEGQLFISMTYYEGETLQNRIDRGPLQIDQAITITLQVAQGLLKAHSKGIIHRDIKPGNIFITEDGVAKILDFGLAKLGGETRITKEGTTAGTIAYMSPEQAQGEDVDETTDIWSLGVVLYEMLTGVLPFKGENWRVTLYSILNTQPESITQMRKEIPKAVENIVEQMMQKDTKTRYQDTTTLITDLSSVARESGFSIPHIIVRKPIRTKRLIKMLLPGSILALLALSMLIIKGILFPTKASVQKMDIAVVAFKNLTGEDNLDYLTVAIPNLLITSLEGYEHVSVITWERMYDLAAAVRKDVELIDEEIGFDICRNQGIETIILGSFTKADDVFATDAKVLDVKTKKIIKSATSKGTGTASIINTQIDELSNTISLGIGVPEHVVRKSQTRISDVTTSSMEAYTHFLQGREYYGKRYTADARRHFEMAVEIDTTFATAYLHLAWTLDGQKSEDAFKKAKKFSNKVSERESLYIEASYANAIDDNWEKYLRILNLIAQKYPQEKRVYTNLGYFYRRHGLFAEAIEAYGKSLKLNAMYDEALIGMAYTYLDMEVFKTALEYFKRYQSLYPDDANTFDTMGDIYFHMGNPDDAIISYKKALEIKPDFPPSIWKLAYIYALKENYDTALQWCDYYITHAPSPGTQASAYALKAFICFWLGNLAQWDYNFQKLTYLSTTTGQKGKPPRMERVAGALYYNLGDLKRSRMHLQNYLDSINIFEPSQSPWRTAYYNFCCGFIDIEERRYESCRSRLAVIKSLIPKIARKEHWISYRHDLLYAELLLHLDSLNKADEVCQRVPSIGSPDLIQWNTMVNNLFMNSDVLARIYVRQEKIEKAIIEYEKLVTYDPRSREWHLIDPQYHYKLARLYEKTGKYAQAIAEYEKYINILKESDAYLNDVNAARKRVAALKS